MAKATLSENGNSLNANPVPFAFKDHQIRTVMNANEPWFVAKDICVALSIDWSGKTLASIPTSWVSMGKVPIPQRGLHRVKIISEPAVYKLAFRSNKAEADEFTNWVASVVLPSIRRTGTFEVKPLPAPPQITILTTEKERKPLVSMVNRYVWAFPDEPTAEAFKRIWRKVHDAMGINDVKELTIYQLPQAMAFMQSLLDTLPTPRKPLPAPVKSTLLASDCMNKRFTDMLSFINSELCLEIFNRRREIGLPFPGASRSEIDASNRLAYMPSEMAHQGSKMVEAGFTSIYEAFKLLESLGCLKGGR